MIKLIERFKGVKIYKISMEGDDPSCEYEAVVLSKTLTGTLQQVRQQIDEICLRLQLLRKK